MYDLAYRNDTGINDVDMLFDLIEESGAYVLGSPRSGVSANDPRLAHLLEIWQDGDEMMPPSLCGDLNVRYGCTYAQAARAIRQRLAGNRWS
jgi:hypothetical protein